MPKGRTNQPLVIWCWYPWITHPEIVALADAGHTLVGIQSESSGVTGINGADARVATPDLILHPRAHKWDAVLFGDEAADRTSMLPAALRMARAEKRGAK